MDWVKAITFDFWGTLVDVDTSGALGMRKALTHFRLDGLDPVRTYHDWDAATVRIYRATTWKPYRAAAASGLREILAPHLGGDSISPHEWSSAADLLVSTMTSEARPHKETPEVVDSLAEKYPLMPITNMDTDLFRMNPFGRRFLSYTTAEEAKAFKPQEKIFRLALEKLALAPKDVLHVSLSQVHDIEGVKPLGIRCAWINRASEKLGSLTPLPDYEFRDLNGVRDLFLD